MRLVISTLKSSLLETVRSTEGHSLKVIRDSSKPRDLVSLLHFHLLISLDDLSLLCKVFSHLVYLAHVLALEVNDLLEGFLVHPNHLHVLWIVLVLKLVLRSLTLLLLPSLALLNGLSLQFPLKWLRVELAHRSKRLTLGCWHLVFKDLLYRGALLRLVLWRCGTLHWISAWLLWSLRGSW